MAVSLTINNKTFQIPSPGEDPGWGGDTTDWIKEANAVINSLFGPGDILQSSFNIANDVSSAQNILGLSFDPANVRAAEIQYSVYRRSDANTSGNTETGMIRLSYDNDAGAGFKWQMSQDYNGDAGITFDIDESTGQLTYVSTDIDATGYSGVMKFRAKALAQ